MELIESGDSSYSDGTEVGGSLSPAVAVREY